MKTTNFLKNTAHLLKETFNQAAYSGKDPVYEDAGLKQLLGSIQSSAGYSQAVTIENAAVCVTQIASVDNTPTVFIANFSGLKGSENANPFPAKNVRLTFHNASRNSHVSFIPFAGHPQDLAGEWKDGNLVVILPEFLRGAIVQLK